jgi:uncharacterized protein YegL
MREDYTHICCITDRSGSMSNLVGDVIGGFNQFLEDQKKESGTATMTYVQFNHEYELVHSMKPLDQIEPLTRETFRPRGSTALLDAIGRTVVTAGEQLAKMEEKDRPAKVICVIITDGAENDSSEYRLEQVREMIKHQTEKYNWAFLYLGADANAFNDASEMGFAVGNVIHFAATGRGAKAAYGAVTRGVASYRSGVCDSYSVGTSAVDPNDQDLSTPENSDKN